MLDGDSKNIPVAYADTVTADDKRKHLLLLTRRADPLFAVFDVRHIGFTALPRVLFSLNFLIITVAYTSTAVLTRIGKWPFPDSEDTVDDDMRAFDGMELLVTFNLVFYFGYCYNRFWQQLELAMKCKNAISAVCSVARASSLNSEDLQDLWKWLNLAHICGYVGLSAVYTRVNLLEGVAKRHNLLGRKSHELQRINDLDLDNSRTPVAYGEFLIWVLRIIDLGTQEGTVSHASAENMQQAILQMRMGMTGLFDLQFHVIPFCYVHLVALLTNCYLVVIAVAKGRLFAPDATLGRGLIFPLLALSFLAISCLSLVEIGGRMQNPIGGDEEDLPVHHLVERTCQLSKELIESHPPPSLASRGRSSAAWGLPDAHAKPRSPSESPTKPPAIAEGRSLDQMLTANAHAQAKASATAISNRGPSSLSNRGASSNCNGTKTELMSV